MSLRPDETIQKIMLSSTCAFIGEYVSENLLVTHAWPNFHDRTMFDKRREGPHSRSAYMVCFTTPPLIREPGVRIPEYGSFGQVLAAMKSLLFGKRFDNHGATETTGHFNIPDLSSFHRTCNPELPQNSHKPRANFGIKLDLGEVERITPLIFWRDGDQAFHNTFHTALKFYHQALQNAEVDFEIAYLNLITAGEVLSNAFEYDKSDMLDEQIKLALFNIERECADGAKIARIVTSRLLQVKKRFVRTLCNLLDDKFFVGCDLDEPWMALKKDDIERTIAAAYELRSKYVHTGISFGGWIEPATSALVSERMIGEPVLQDSELKRILIAAPSYVGLERVMRYCLLRYAQKNGVFSYEPPITTDEPSAEATMKDPGADGTVCP